MRHSRWRRRRYYPLFLEELAKKVYYLLASLDVDIQWFHHVSKVLKGISDVDLVPIVIFQPEEIYSYSTVILLDEQIRLELESILGREITFSCGCISSSERKNLLQTLFQINEITNPFQIYFPLLYAAFTSEVYEDASALSAALHLRKAEAEILVFLKIIHSLLCQRRPLSITPLSLDFFSLISFGFIYPLTINFLSSISGISPAIVFSLILSHKFKFSVPLYSDKIIFHLKPLCLSRGIKYFSESETEISPFLSPIKLDTGFLFQESLVNRFFSETKIQSQPSLLTPFWLGEGRRSPDIITLALRLSSFIKYSSPDLFALTLSLMESYDFSRRLTPALTLITKLYEKEIRSYQFILDLLVSDVGADFLIDIYKLVFDLIEAKLLQPAVAKIKI